MSIMLLVGSQSTTDDDSATVIFAKALPLGNAGRGLQMRGRGNTMPSSIGSGSGGDFFLVLRFVLFGERASEAYARALEGM